MNISAALSPKTFGRPWEREQERDGCILGCAMRPRFLEKKKKTGQMREMCVGVKSIESNTKQRALGVSAEFGIVYI